MPKVFTSKNQVKGEIGENIACRFLVKHGFTILERNFTKKWGEIDVIAEKDGKMHFIEVKSMSFDFSALDSVTQPKYGIRPEDNMTQQKLTKLRRTIESYLMSVTQKERVLPTGQAQKQSKPWQVDLLCIYVDQQNKKAQVRTINNIIL
jgi:putative endonuclease